MTQRSKPGVWCMEGAWSSRVTDVRSVGPVLSALEDAKQARQVRVHLNTPDDLAQALKRWTQNQHARYSIGYMALHGGPETIFTGRRQVTWRQIEQWTEGSLTGKTLHFGSCSVLDTSPKRREEFRRNTGLKAVTGFTKDVDWFESLAFELLLFEALTHYTRLADVEKHLKSVAGSLWKRTGFVVVRARR